MGDREGAAVDYMDLTLAHYGSLDEKGVQGCHWGHHILLSCIVYLLGLSEPTTFYGLQWRIMRRHGVLVAPPKQRKAEHPL